MKFIFLTILVFYSAQLLAQNVDVCNKLECVDEDFKNKNYIKYYTILNKTLVDARGCKDNKKLDNVLEFTRKITKTGSRERMAQFIEKEFINNPVCIFSAMARISHEARYKTSLYLAKPTFMNGKKIKAILDKYNKQYPEEIHLIITGAELKYSK